MGGISVMLLMGMLSAMYIVLYSSNCCADYLFCSKLCF